MCAFRTTHTKSVHNTHSKLRERAVLIRVQKNACMCQVLMCVGGGGVASASASARAHNIQHTARGGGALKRAVAENACVVKACARARSGVKGHGRGGCCFAGKRVCRGGKRRAARPNTAAVDAAAAASLPVSSEVLLLLWAPRAR